MQNLNLNVTIDDSGHVASATLTGTMVETTVGKCPYPSLGTQQHSYSGGGSFDGQTMTIELNPDSNNAPHATATFFGHIVNGRLNGTLTLHRLEARPNLAWTLQSVVK